MTTPLPSPSRSQQERIDLSAKLLTAFPELTIAESLAAAEAIIRLRSSPSSQEEQGPKGP